MVNANKRVAVRCAECGEDEDLSYIVWEGRPLCVHCFADAVAQYAQDGSAAVLAVQAGNDMVLTTDFETQIPQVIAAVEDGTIPMEQIDQSVARVLSWKYDLGLLGY